MFSVIMMGALKLDNVDQHMDIGILILIIRVAHLVKMDNMLLDINNVLNAKINNVEDVMILAIQAPALNAIHHMDLILYI